MAGRLTDKIALVTGGASGIGRATVLRFAEEGAAVVAADRNPGGLEQTKSLVQQISPDIETVTVDVSKWDQVERMVDAAVARFGRLDVLVNAAGVLILTPPLAEVDERHWDLMMSTNLKGLFFCCKAAIPAMLQNGGGSIVNIASMAGVQAYSQSLPYAVSKAAIIHLNSVAASQYTSQGIQDELHCAWFCGHAAGARQHPEHRSHTESGPLSSPGPHRAARGDRQHDSLSGLRRSVLHQRFDLYCGRRLVVGCQPAVRGEYGKAHRDQPIRRWRITAFGRSSSGVPTISLPSGSSRAHEAELLTGVIKDELDRLPIPVEPPQVPHEQERVAGIIRQSPGLDGIALAGRFDGQSGRPAGANVLSPASALGPLPRRS